MHIRVGEDGRADEVLRPIERDGGYAWLDSQRLVCQALKFGIPGIEREHRRTGSLYVVHPLQEFTASPLRRHDEQCLLPGGLSKPVKTHRQMGRRARRWSPPDQGWCEFRYACEPALVV